MNRKPIFSLIRFFVLCALVFFFGMQWWSYTLIEKELKTMRIEMKQFKSRSVSPIEPYSVQANSKYISQANPSLPNLLEEDPFYSKTLPKLLGENFTPHGTFREATLGKPKNLHPFGNMSDSNSWTNLCSGSVGQMKLGIYESSSPNFAWKMELRMHADTQEPEYWVHLRENLAWQPLSSALFEGSITLADHFLNSHPVTAHDFKFYFDAIMNPFVEEPGAVAMRNYIGKIKEIEVVDDRTFIVRWATKEMEGVKKMPYIAKSWTLALRPFPGFVYKYFSDGSKIIEDEKADAYRTNSVFAQNLSNHWAKNVIPSCAEWVFEGMTDKQISFMRNADFYQNLANLMDKRIVYFKDSVETWWQSFKTGELDVYNLTPDQLNTYEEFKNSIQYQTQVKEGNAIKELEVTINAFSYIAWNQKSPYFTSKKVRQAMTLAIDRNRIIRTIRSGMGEEITGGFFVHSPSYDTTIAPYPFDPQQAKQLLEEEGWYDHEGKGVISKEINGVRVPFSFSITYYVKNPISESICQYVSAALKELGIVCLLRGVDVADLSANVDDKDFDALQMAWTGGSPPEDPRQLWYSSGANQKGSSNLTGFMNAEADQLIDYLEYEDRAEQRLKLYHRFHAILHEEQPYTFLYTPKTLLLYREKLQNVFIPLDRQDLIPGANVAEPLPSIYWLKK